MSAISSGCWSAARASIWSAGRRPTPIFPCSKSSPACAMPSRAPWRGSKNDIRASSACTTGSGNESASPLILIRIAAFRSIRWAFSDTTRSWTCEAGATDSKHVGDVGGPPSRSGICAAIAISPAEFLARYGRLGHRLPFRQHPFGTAGMKRQQDQLAIECVERLVHPLRQFPQARAEIGHLSPQNGGSHQGYFVTRLQQRHQGKELLLDYAPPMRRTQQLDESLARDMKFQHGVARLEPHSVVERPWLLRQPGYVLELFDAPQPDNAIPAFEGRGAARSFEFPAHEPAHGEGEKPSQRRSEQDPCETFGQRRRRRSGRDDAVRRVFGWHRFLRAHLVDPRSRRLEIPLPAVGGYMPALIGGIEAIEPSRSWSRNLRAGGNIRRSPARCAPCRRS